MRSTGYYIPSPSLPHPRLVPSFTRIKNLGHPSPLRIFQSRPTQPFFFSKPSTFLPRIIEFIKEFPDKISSFFPLKCSSFKIRIREIENRFKTDLFKSITFNPLILPWSIASPRDPNLSSGSCRVISIVSFFFFFFLRFYARSTLHSIRRPRGGRRFTSGVTWKIHNGRNSKFRGFNRAIDIHCSV